MPKNLFKIAKEKKIKYFLISFVDLFGILRSKLVPTRAIKEMQEAGAGFAGFAACHPLKASMAGWTWALSLRKHNEFITKPLKSNMFLLFFHWVLSVRRPPA